MSHPYFTITTPIPRTYHIGSPENVYAELFVGDHAALLWDTGYGYWSLSGFVETLTQGKPLMVVNSHGHLDHCCGNVQFSGPIYMHPADHALCRRHTGPEMRHWAVQRARSCLDNRTGKKGSILPPGFDEAAYAAQESWCHLLPVEEGHRFELGGLTLRTVELPGHTAGCLGLIYEEEQVLYTGDAIAKVMWLFLPETLSLGAYMDTLYKAKTLSCEKMVCAHVPTPLPISALDGLLECAETLDFESAKVMPAGVLPIGSEVEVRVHNRPGYRPLDMQREGYAAIYIERGKL